MTTAKVFNTGRSQAVRLPKEYRFKDSEVVINRIGSMVVMFPRSRGWELLSESLNHFSGDFLADRNQPYGNEKRKKI
jgi:antitoxin VapB